MAPAFFKVLREKWDSMKKLFFKSLRKSRGDFGVIVSCGIFVISIIYITTFISDSLIQITTGSRGTATQVYINLGVFILTYVILGVMMILMMIAYIRKRSYEYAMFDILGMKRKHKFRFIGCEYGGIIICSLTGGIAAGELISFLVLPVLRLLLHDGSLSASRNLVPLWLTTVVSVVMFGMIFMVCDEMISCLGMDAVLAMGKRSGKNYRPSVVPLIIGGSFAVLSFAFLFSYWGKVNKAIPAALLSVGILCLMPALGGRWLRMVQKKKDYHKRVLWMDQWYHRFYYNMNLSVVMAALIFINLFSFGIKICDHVPVLPESSYPYDIVWMGDSEDEEFISGLAGRYGVKIRRQPCIRVTTPDFGEHMGISASAYEDWTKEKVKLSGKQIYVVYQRNREERNLLGIDYGGGRPRLYIGKARKNLWILTGCGYIAGNEFKREYQVAGEGYRDMTGVYLSRGIEDWHTDVWEQVIVFSDEYFGQVKDTAEGADLAVMISTPEGFSKADYQRLREDVYAYAKEHSQENFLDYKQGNLIYEKTVEMGKCRQVQILRLSSAGINIFILMLCVVFILWIKGKCDYEDMRWKYQFLTLSGMEEEKRRACMKKELLLPAVISFLGGVPAALIFIAGDVSEKHLGVKWNLRYLAEMSGIAAAVVLVLAGAAVVFTLRTVRKLEKEEV